LALAGTFCWATTATVADLSDLVFRECDVSMEVQDNGVKFYAPGILTFLSATSALRRELTEQKFSFSPTHVLGFKLDKFAKLERGELTLFSLCATFMRATVGDCVLVYPDDNPILWRRDGTIVLRARRNAYASATRADQMVASIATAAGNPVAYEHLPEL
jgi:hypothetical protein